METPDLGTRVHEYLLTKEAATAAAIQRALDGLGIQKTKREINSCLYQNPRLFKKTADHEETLEWQAIPGAVRTTIDLSADEKFQIQMFTPAIHCFSAQNQEGIKHILTVPVSEAYGHKDWPRIECPPGVRVVSYASVNVITSLSLPRNLVDPEEGLDEPCALIIRVKAKEELARCAQVVALLAEIYRMAGHPTFCSL